MFDVLVDWAYKNCYFVVVIFILYYVQVDFVDFTQQRVDMFGNVILLMT